MNQIKFKIISPYLLKEPWVKKYGKPDGKGVEIYIDGETLPSILNTDNYGHVSPKTLFEELSQALQPDTIQYEEGADLYCCFYCGDNVCSTIEVMIRQTTDNTIRWLIHYMEKNYIFSFDKLQYQTAVDSLRKDI